MSDREQRLRWIESLISGNQQTPHRSNALVVPTTNGSMAVAFASVEKVVAASEVRPFAFLPREFSGVLPWGYELVPVLDTENFTDEASAHVVIVRSENHLLGLRFVGTPYVVDLDETKHAPLKTCSVQGFDHETLPVLDIDAIIDTLLAAD